MSYPASSPYVIAIGGHTLLSNSNGDYDGEIAWYSGGGGLSQVETAPFWRSSAVSLVTLTSDRAVPDVALDADPNSGATVYVNGRRRPLAAPVSPRRWRWGCGRGPSRHSLGTVTRDR